MGQLRELGAGHRVGVDHDHHGHAVVREEQQVAAVARVAAAVGDRAVAAALALEPADRHRALLIAGRLPHHVVGRGLQDPLAAQLAATQVGHRPAAHVHQVRVEGRAGSVHAVVGIHGADDHGHAVAQHVRAGGQPGVRLGAEQRAVLHAQRREDVRLDVALERLAGHLRDHVAQHLVGHVAVLVALAGGGDQLAVRQAAYVALQRAVVGDRLLPLVAVNAVNVRHARGVAQHLPHGDRRRARILRGESRGGSAARAGRGPPCPSRPAA